MGLTVSVAGLGKLGASMAAAIASRGYKVIGVDINLRAVELINQGHAPVQETDLETTINANRDRITATLSHREAVVNSDITFVVVPTPSDENGAFSLQYAAWAFREIGRALKEKTRYHNVVLTSTVLPGSSRYGLLPILEAESGKVCGRDFGLCYSPEFIALGNVMRDFLNPDFLLIGEFDHAAGAHLEECYKAIVQNGAPCRRMSLENAELAKIALNTFVTTKITFANMLADFCERLPGGNVDVVTEALGLDRRIGGKYLTGGLGYGGPCFPRDNVALSFLAEALGTSADLAGSTDRFNRLLPQRLVNWLRETIPSGSTVAMLGLAYKPNSHVIEASQAIALAEALSKSGARVVAFDPLAGDAAQAHLGDRAVILRSVGDCLSQAEVALIATPDPVFRQLTINDFRRMRGTRTVVDFWRILDRELTGRNDIRYIRFGCSSDDELNAQRLRDLWKTATREDHVGN